MGSICVPALTGRGVYMMLAAGCRLPGTGRVPVAVPVGPCAGMMPLPWTTICGAIYSMYTRYRTDLASCAVDAPSNIHLHSSSFQQPPQRLHELRLPLPTCPSARP